MNLQGMIVQGFNTFTYISISPCKIFRSPEEIEEITLYFLFFLMLQYSLYPIILVYDYNAPTVD